MVRIPIVLITPSDKKYKLSPVDFKFVKTLIMDTRCDTSVDTSKKVASLMRSSLKFTSGMSFKLKIAALDVDPTRFTISCEQFPLSKWEVHYMSNLIHCAAASAAAILILPSYIIVRSTKPAGAKDKKASTKSATPKKPGKKQPKKPSKKAKKSTKKPSKDTKNG